MAQTPSAALPYLQNSYVAAVRDSWNRAVALLTDKAYGALLTALVILHASPMLQRHH
jgi:hypothetical protein